MAGCKLFVISGIDGEFTEFDSLIVPVLTSIDIVRLPYRRNTSFMENLKEMNEVIKEDVDRHSVLGWSMGAVMACFLSYSTNTDNVILINPFFRRSDILKRRNIYCDEEVCIDQTAKADVRYTIICGAKDDKISPSESQRIIDYYALNQENLYTFETASHCLSSFPKIELSNLIKKLLQ